MQDTYVGDIKRLYVGRKEKAAFYFGAMFRDMSYAIMAFLTYLYIDIMGLSGVALGLVLVIGRVWDGVNDPIVGIYFDRSVTAKAKAKPFFKRTAIPVAILIIFIFYCPTFSPDPKVNMWLRALYALITYVLFEGLHTLNGTSFMSLYNSITPNKDEKCKIISQSRLFSTIGTGIIGGGIPILLSFFENDDVVAKTYIYFFTAVFVAICFVIYNFLIHKYVNERVIHVPERRQKTKEMFISFSKNKMLLLLMVSNTIAGLINPGTTALWFFTYNMGNAALMTYVGLLGLPFLVLGIVIVPYANKYMDKSKIVIWSSVLQIALNIAYLLSGYHNLITVLIFNAVLLFPLSLKGALYWSMISDSIDYLEWRTGDRNDGMVFAIEGFLAKCVGSIGALSTVIIVAAIKYVPNAVQQSESTMKGLFYVPIIITIVSIALSTIPYFFYDFTNRKHEQALLEIRQRKLTATE